MYRIEVWFSNTKFKNFFEQKIKEVMKIPLYVNLLYREHNSVKEI